MRTIDAQLLRELIVFAALGELAKVITEKEPEELLSAETIAQIDAVLDAHETVGSLAATAELLALLDATAAKIIALGGGGDRSEETGEDTAAA